MRIGGISEFCYWWLFFIIYVLLLPITGTFSPRGQEIFWLFVAQPAVAALIAWAFAQASLQLSESHKRSRKAREERRRDARARAQAEADRLKEEATRPERHRAAQQQLAIQLNTLITQSATSTRELLSLIAEAKKSLDLAEFEFGEGAIVLFWNAVETAIDQLTNADRTVHRLIENGKSYQKGAAGLETRPPRFHIGLDQLPDARGTASRMYEIFRRGQKNDRFALIYQERTIAEVSTDAQTIAELPDRLQSSLGQLASILR